MSRSRHIRLEVDGIVATFTLAPTPAHDGKPDASNRYADCSEWSFVSEIEERVIRLLLDEPGELSGRAIATRLDETPDGSKMKGILANLVARHVLSTGHDGYYLALSEEKKARLRLPV